MIALTKKDLLTRVQEIRSTGCWQFLGSVDAYGFGRMFAWDREYKAHRVFYETWEGVLPLGQYLLHHLPADKCIGNLCCNPEHMAVSHQRRDKRFEVPGRPHAAQTTKPPAERSIPELGTKTCPKGHPMTKDNIVIEKRKGHPKIRCRTCRQASWRKNSARRAAEERHT